MGSGLDSLLIFKMRGIKTSKSDQPDQQGKGRELMEVHEELPQLEAQPVFVPQPQAPPPKEAVAQAKKSLQDDGSNSIYYKVSGEYPDPIKYYKGAPAQEEAQQEVAVEKHPMPRVMSRENAKNKFCSTHPFRHAYALCAFCHRPFCFEDIVEYRREYYCVNDIERVEAQHTEKVTYEYGIASLITAFLLIVAFVTYIYFSHGSIIYLFQLISSTGVLKFFITIKLAYILELASVVVMFFTIGAAIYVLSGARSAHVTVATITVLAVALLTYQFITTFTQYIALLDLLEFAAFISAVYAASSGVAVYNQNYETIGGYGLAYGSNTRF